MQLYNKLSAQERARIIDENSQERITLSFYKYFKLGNPSLFRDHLFILWSNLDVLGRIYVAKEGINAQLSVPKENFEKFKIVARKKAYQNRSNLKWETKLKGEQ